ncbi:hypothetical protein CERSUDRAFT_82659 [Gelatoporia subvermispora B]|uniref:Protein transport protein sec16 n=1 Tax=Ceriporiopsis subvermispora (strain B) TaxID=914234 RepID=M2QN10_CERS8|nr:hypothetical protein CERSUDRAFT_82659 [Gelatoporia subvermispora B]
MSTAGEAASLFGAADSAADPFAAVLGGDQADATTATSHAATADLFDSVPDSAGLFAGHEHPDEAAQVDSTPWLGTQPYDSHETGGAAAYGSGSAGYAHQQQNNTWHDTYDYGLTSQQPSYDNDTASNAPVVPPQGYSNHNYDQYAPYASAYEPSRYSTPAAPLPSTAQAYDPYKPDASSVVAYPSSSSTTVTHSAYDPYRPSTTSSYQPAAVSAQSIAYGSSTVPAGQVQPLAGLIIPPAPTSTATPPAPPFRPKTSNAYDPPLPPPKPRRSTAPTWQADQYMSPPMATPAQLPPPPRSARSPIPPPPHRGVSPLPSTTPQSTVIPVVPQADTPLASLSTSVPVNGSAVNAIGKVANAPNGYFGAVGTESNTSRSQHSTSGLQQPGLVQSATYDHPQSESFMQDPEDFTLTHVVDVHPEGLRPNANPHEEATFDPAYDHMFAPTPNRDHSANREEPSVASGTPSPRSTNSSMAYQPQVHAARRNSHSSFGSAPEQSRARSPGAAVTRARARSPLSNPSVYEPLLTSGSPERVRSPYEVTDHSTAAMHLEPPNYSGPLTLSPPPASTQLQWTNGHTSATAESQLTVDPRRATSPATSVHSMKGLPIRSQDPYAPPIGDHAASSSFPRSRSQSNGSTHSTSAVRDDPYAPSRHARKQPSESSSYTGSVSSYQFDPIPEGVVHAGRPGTGHDLSSSQVLSIPPPNRSAYAPSPSLLGTNDPLGRTSVRIPVISFGFGGKLVTCFHGADTLNTGFDVALSARQSTDIKLYTLHKVVPESVLDTSTASYPGPLFSDPGTISSSLISTGITNPTKTKKGLVVKYLEERSEELSRGTSYLPIDSPERKHSEAKHTLVRLLKVLVENDGRLAGSPQVEAAVRAALVPRLSSSEAGQDGVYMASSGPYVGDSSTSLTATSSLLHATLSSLPSDDTPLTVHSLRSSNLDKIQEFLLRGDRRGACHYASDEKLWAHALVIASSIDKDMWKEVVTEFVRSELADRDSGPTGFVPLSEALGKPRVGGGREALRVAYSLFAGQGAASVQELLPPKQLLQNSQTLQLPSSLSSSLASVTPVSPNFPAPAPPMDIPSEILAKWADTAAMMLSNPTSSESVAALTALGDQLAANKWCEAAHACYLLSQSSPAVSSPGTARLAALNSQTASNFFRNQDTIIFNEILEFAISLVAPSKGQDAFTGLPYLQPLRFMRATVLAELGHVHLARRYCEAIANCVGRGPAYYSPMFVDQLKGLSDRLVAAPQLDKSNSWIGSKMAKPSLDSLGNWLEGRFKDFIAGESDVQHDDTAAVTHQQPAAGPFAHYSTISSVASSTMPSPRQSHVDLPEAPNSPPFRTGSAMAVRSLTMSTAPVNRASSAMDHVRPFERKPSPIPRVSSASATTTAFANGSLYSQALNGHAFGSAVKQDLTDVKQSEGADHSQSHEQSNGSSMGAWWGSSDSGSGAPTPTASSFVRLDEEPATNGTTSGFISLMDDPAYSITPVATSSPNPIMNGASRDDFGDEEDDLGLGNSSGRPKRQESTNQQGPAPAQVEEPKPAQQPQKPELKTATTGSWLSRIWRRSETPGPVKANLGEQTSFYYDQELKKWVNKNVGADDATKPSAPPPPPRAQTASPGRSQAPLSAGTSAGPPPARPATVNAMGAGSGPPSRPPMRVRSNLVPPDSEDPNMPPTPLSAPPMSGSSTPPPSGGPPPAGRAKGAAKRPVRNRYVDVFQQQAAS